MKVTFYGTRGSIPVPDKNFVEVGGNTSCILITFKSGRIAILDAGTGIRKLGNDLIARSHEQFDDIIIGLSHTHWDHIQGFPFFKLAYDPRRHFTIAISGKDKIESNNLQAIFATQMQSEFFPVPLDKMGANFTFWQPDFTKYNHPKGIEIVASRHEHPGYSYGYRITEDDKSLVYCTDVEHFNEIDSTVIELSRNADLLIHDAQYTAEELAAKRGWGHSSWVQAVEVAERAKVKKLALFHHDPEHDDAFLFEMEKQIRQRFSDAFIAREGMTVEL